MSSVHHSEIKINMEMDSLAQLDLKSNLNLESIREDFETLREEIRQLKKQNTVFQDYMQKELTKSRNESTSKAPATSTTIQFIFRLFLVGTILEVTFLTIQTGLIFSNFQYLTSSTAFFIVNLLGVAWAIFGLGFSVGYAPSLRLLQAYQGVYLVGCILETIWINDTFGAIAAVFFSFSVLVALMALLTSRGTFLVLTILPVNDKTTELFFTSWRLFIVVVTPLVARFIQNGTASQVAYFAVTIYCLAMAHFCTSSRVMFAIYPSNSVAALFVTLRLSTLIKMYAPIFGELLVFAVLYVIEVSGSSSFVHDSVIISLLSFAVFLFMYLQMVFSARPIVGWRIFTWLFYAFHPEEIALLKLERRKGSELRGFSTDV